MTEPEISISKCSEKLAVRSVYLSALLLSPWVGHMVPFKVCWSSEKRKTKFRVLVIFFVYISTFTDIGI